MFTASAPEAVAVRVGRGGADVGEEIRVGTEPAVVSTAPVGVMVARGWLLDAAEGSVSVFGVEAAGEESVVDGFAAAAATEFEGVAATAAFVESVFAAMVVVERMARATTSRGSRIFVCCAVVCVVRFWRTSYSWR